MQTTCVRLPEQRRRGHHVQHRQRPRTIQIHRERAAHRLTPAADKFAGAAAVLVASS
ncbi:hypothetical protein [Streptomyces xantholiticus]|uniref:Uncharacterized protein n=1 Tax=Streptomyces xantholiticus TaxID=68285 RepID=A0ABV1UN73_9ACTN